MTKKLACLFKNSKRLKIDDTPKMVIMSDCRRGLVMVLIIISKMKTFIQQLYYYSRWFTYIELGDGAEMWEANDYQASKRIEKELKEWSIKNSKMEIWKE